jgi:hypothetical protein
MKNNKRPLISLFDAGLCSLFALLQWIMRFDRKRLGPFKEIWRDKMFF